MNGKSELRREMTKLRASLSVTAQSQAARGLAQMLQQVFTPKQSYIVGCYNAFGGELSLDAAIRYLDQGGHVIALPRVNNAAHPPEMHFHRWSVGAPLHKGAFGIEEPDGDILRPDILFVPLLAFDQTGARLGRGGGFYDRYLERARQDAEICAVGVALAEQEVEKCPTESHDQALDAILTPSKFVSINTSKLLSLGFVAR